MQEKRKPIKVKLDTTWKKSMQKKDKERGNKSAGDSLQTN